MRAVVQRVKQASVRINHQTHAEIRQGLLILLGIESKDSLEDVQWLAAKIIHLRIFNDAQGVMNLSAEEINGQCLVVSQFTLHASTKKGKRPSYVKAAPPEIAIPLYDAFIQTLKEISTLTIQSGVFGADMQVALINDGPVTLIIDTKNKE
ncbi:MAG: D-aminoacyl-tRNA deacylase [Candidatus Saccharimonadaceae bacterium]|nr:D-aminoacyl-tRNA deacylase [Candidatus Saccharimonadaceae bacterium]MDD4210186.1 D-aminoacyl-tRNA deacylase [Bacteroidales bacterium]